MSLSPQSTHHDPTPELSELERVVDGLQRAWMRADDEQVERAHRAVEDAMKTCLPEQRELFESALARLERARRQARLRHRKRH